MKSSSFWAITKKEFLGFMNSPLAYVIIVPFLLLVSFMFFRTALVLGDANLRPFIELLPWFLIVIGPAIGMRSFSEEQRKQTVELLYAHPVSEWTIVMGKCAGLALFYLVMLASTLLLPLTLIAFSQPDVGLMFSQYLGAVCVGSLFLAVGLATSVYIASAVGSFLLGAAINFLLTLIGLSFIVLMLPGPVARFVSELAVQSHLTNFSRGVVDLRDLLYFATLIGIALAASVLKLSERKVTESKAEKNKLFIIMGLIVGVGLLANLLMAEFPLQLDLTKNHRYSLSAGSKELLKSLPDRVVMTLYTSDNLPGPMQVTLRDVGDLLKDFRRYGSKLQVNSVVVGNDQAKRAEAAKQGVREVQFNQIGSTSFQVQTGFLGLVIRYGDKTDVIDFIEDAGNLEYELSRRLLKLTRTTQPNIGLIQTGMDSASTTLSQMLTDQYRLVTLTDTSFPASWKDLAAVVVIDDGTGRPSATVSGELGNFLKNGGRSAWFIDGVSVNSQSQAVKGTFSTSPFIDLLKDYGITLRPDLVYDLQRNEAITLSNGSLRYIVSYPFWIRPATVSKNAGWATVDSAVLGWASSLVLNDTNGWQPKPLLETSQAAGTQTDTFTLTPNQVNTLAAPSGKSLTVAAAVEKNNQRLSVIADSQITTDDFLMNSEEDRTLVSNVIDWVAADPLLVAIPRRSAGRTVFTFKQPSQVQMVQGVNLAVPPIAVAAFGFWWLHRRRQLTRRIYHEQ